MELPKPEFWFDYGCCLWNHGGVVGIDEDREMYRKSKHWIDTRG